MGEHKLLFERILGLDDFWNQSNYASVNNWIRAIRRRGDRRSTKLAYFKWLSHFLRFLNLNADEDLELGNRYGPAERREELIVKIRAGMHPDRLVRLRHGSISEKVQAFCDKYNDLGKARTAHSTLNVLRSFFKHNGIEGLDLEDYNWRRSKRLEYVPTKEDVYKMADHCDRRGRAIILFTYQSGLRNATLRALCYGDLGDQLKAGTIPLRIHVDSRLRSRISEACKGDAEYFTFAGKEAIGALKEYTDWRTGKKGEIKDDEPLFAPYEAFGYTPPRNQHLSEDSPQRLIKRAARRARIKEWRHVRFHSLRKTFRATLDAGYVDGGQMAEDDKEFLMGHRLPSQKKPYHTANVNVLAERYMKLNWIVGKTMTESAKLEAIKAFARTLGVDNIGVKIAKIREREPNRSEEEIIGRIIRKKLGISKLDIQPSHKKIVAENELEPYLAHGWELETILPSGRILIKNPRARSF